MLKSECTLENSKLYGLGRIDVQRLAVGQSQQLFPIVHCLRLKGRVIGLSTSNLDDLVFDRWLIDEDVKLTDVVLAVEPFIGMNVEACVCIVPRTAAVFDSLRG